MVKSTSRPHRNALGDDDEDYSKLDEDKSPVLDDASCPDRSRASLVSVTGPVGYKYAEHKLNQYHTLISLEQNHAKSAEASWDCCIPPSASKCITLCHKINDDRLLNRDLAARPFRAGDYEDNDHRQEALSACVKGCD